jgi:hypothetical protein
LLLSLSNLRVGGRIKVAFVSDANFSLCRPTLLPTPRCRHLLTPPRPLGNLFLRVSTTNTTAPPPSSNAAMLLPLHHCTGEALQGAHPPFGWEEKPSSPPSHWVRAARHSSPPKPTLQSTLTPIPAPACSASAPNISLGEFIGNFHFLKNFQRLTFDQ